MDLPEETDGEWRALTAYDAVVRGGREAVTHLLGRPFFVQRQGASLLLSPDTGEADGAIAHIRIQFSAGPKVYAKDADTGETLAAMAVILQQISILPSERGRRHPARIMDELNAAAAEIDRVLVIQSVLSDRLERTLRRLGATELPYEPGSYVYQPPDRERSPSPKRLRLRAALRKWYQS